MQSSNIEDDCANFAFRLIVGYASENGLPLKLRSASGQIFDAANKKYKIEEDGKNKYLDDVRGSLNAKDIPSNTFNVSQEESHSGDMEIFKYSLNNGNRVNFTIQLLFLILKKIIHL